MRTRRALIIVFAAIAAACSPALDWREFSWREGGFAVLLPGKPRSESRPLVIDGVEVTMRMFSVRAEGLAFGVGYADFPPGGGAEAQARRIAATRDALVANIDGRLTAQGDVALERHRGIDFRATGRVRDTDYFVAGRVYAAGDRLYQLAVVGRADAATTADAELFLGSLRLLPP
ncbi:MAG: hypothetical protein MUF79_10445 [Burkholderiales bacterium]|jgi:hypothetical protein|nr:hypothetical protein [Burkholderiales bacterium]